MPRIHLVNPSAQSFGVAVITPRWLFVLAAATGTAWGTPRVVDETLEPLALDKLGARLHIALLLHELLAGLKERFGSGLVVWV